VIPFSRVNVGRCAAAAAFTVKTTGTLVLEAKMPLAPKRTVSECCPWARDAVLKAEDAFASSDLVPSAVVPS
jgi:hypothetical protein